MRVGGDNRYDRPRIVYEIETDVIVRMSKDVQHVGRHGRDRSYRIMRASQAPDFECGYCLLDVGRQLNLFQKMKDLPESDRFHVQQHAGASSVRVDLDDRQL